MLRRLSVVRRVPAYVFSGDPLVIDYTLENGRRWYAALAVFLEDSLVPVDRSVTGSGQPDASGFLRAGSPAAIGRGSAGSARAPSAASIGFAIWIWAPGRRSAWWSIGSRSRYPTRSWFIPRIGQSDAPLVPDAAAGDRKPARPAARPLGAASGIPWPARLSLGRQPALDPLADVGPPRRADGQGVRAAERAGPGDPDRSLAAAHQGRARAAGGPGAGDLVRGDALPGDLPAPGPPAAFWAGPGRRRACGKVRPRSSCCTSCSSNSP